MDKEFIDELYHQLRLTYLSGTIPEKEAIAGIVSHLTQPQKSKGDYTGLLRFLSYYGEKFLMPRIKQIVHDQVLRPDRIVELGSGFCWLGRGLSSELGVPALYIDKRQWVFTDIIADLETKNGVKRVLDEMKDGDLIAMAELLHCLDDPQKTLEPFGKWPMLIVEYHPWHGVAEMTRSVQGYIDSYEDQIKAFDCTPIDTFEDVLPGRELTTFHAFPHEIIIAGPVQEAV